MKIGAIIQARSSSSRLPKKVLKSLPYGSNITVLEQVIRRLKQSKLLDEIIVATTVNGDDDEIVAIAEKENVLYFRGSEFNVLERYYETALDNQLDVVVRITSDCPCVDFTIVDSVIQNHLDSNANYTSNSLVESFPRGIDVEVINFDALKKAFNEWSFEFEKEHVTPFIYKSHPEDFKINSFVNDNLNCSDIRITLDTSKDYALLCAIYDYLYYENEFFLLEDILKLFDEKPWLKIINEDIIQKRVCSNLEEELEEAINLLNTQDLNKAKDFIEGLFRT